MAAAVGLRDDFTAPDLRELARRSGNGGQVRRLLALASIYDGGTRGDAARIGGVSLQTIRDWVLRFNAGGAGALVDRKSAGPRPLLNDAWRRALAEAIEAGPDPALDGVVRWRQADLGQWLWNAFGVSLSQPTLSREIRGLGFRNLTARPRHHAQDPNAIPAFKKTSPPGWRR